MPEKKAAPKKVAEHPTYAAMISAAIVSMKDRKGSSKQAIEKYICANYKVGPKYNGPLKMALRKGVESGALVQTKGKGASGSFKVAKAEKPAAAKKPVAKKPAAKKPAAKKPAAKKPVAKKPAAKKPAAKKSPKKPAKKAASPKKAGKVTKKAPAKKVAKKTPVKKNKAKK